MSARVAIVVGAGGEFGRVTVQKLATAGFTVVGVDRSEEGLKELPDGIRYDVGDATDRPWRGASSSRSPPGLVRRGAGRRHRHVSPG